LNRAQSIALLRALAAVSWADGRLERAEESHLKSLAYNLGLTAEDLRQELQPLLDHPISYDRAMEVVGELTRVLGSAADRERFLTELRRLFEVDGDFSEPEQEMLAEIEAALADYGAADFLIGKLRGAFAPLLGGVRRRSAPVSAELAPYVKNKVLARLLDRFHTSGIDSSLTPAQLNRAALEGAILARVAVAGDEVVDERELVAIGETLASGSDLAGPELEVVLAVLRDGVTETMDRQRLCAEFNRVSSLEERERLVASMFAVAGTDAGSEVQDEIRLLANALWLPTRNFVEIRARWMAGDG